MKVVGKKQAVRGGAESRVGSEPETDSRSGTGSKSGVGSRSVAVSKPRVGSKFGTGSRSRGAPKSGVATRLDDTGKSSGSPTPGVVAKKPRADAERNRNRLIEVAKAAFADVGPEVSLEEIARFAGVGIGTLYRNFPTRDAMLEAVYRREVQQLAAAAAQLLETRSPVEALRAWMRLFIDYIATKKIIAPALNSLTGGTAELFASSSVLIKTAVSSLVDRAVAAGDVRRDVDPIDLLYALVGFANAHNRPGWESSARRLIDILMAGLQCGDA